MRDDDRDDRDNDAAYRRQSPPDAPEHRPYDREQSGHFRKKRRSFLGELFDFN